MLLTDLLGLALNWRALATKRVVAIADNSTDCNNFDSPAAPIPQEVLVANVIYFFSCAFSIGAVPCLKVTINLSPTLYGQCGIPLG